MSTDLPNDKLLKHSDADFRVFTDAIVALKWMENKTVLFISNDPTNLETASRRKKNVSSEEATCPVLVKDYNRHMGFVDKVDMLKLDFHSISIQLEALFKYSWFI